ncbi:MAG: putative transcriptional regulator [Jatrophihabitantaceae bacterium]|nr:putative transcriptional regulator [Jatrophihabitantaceae bacterium]
MMPDAQQSYAAQIGANLRSVRKERGLTMRSVEMLSRGRVRARDLGRWERSEGAMPVDVLLVVAAIYGVPPAAIFPASTRPVVDGGTWEYSGSPVE